ncbi:MBL fold metallo-hydrolase [Sphingomonas fennica]|uniref:MBL fold metallo-hydrolase n=1 Tax=Edaphosphingomonas fennica TaxID=114404 RepID=A0A2T4HM17_9SPHN|nr:MBL fold metallo-hydrolase [Sphingomonas fennica]PTD16808.1 MBL fold metallo-hydrolase [Sphingomonas fennica]
MNSFIVGDVEITRIEESLTPAYPPEFLFPEWHPDYLDRHRDWLAPNFYDLESGKLISSIHSWLIRTRGHVILVDSCAGNDKPRPAFARFDMQRTPYLERLRAAGVAPEDVTHVLCTHLHVDHVGWNTRLLDGRWVPTFPNARYLFSRRESEFWDTRSGEGGRLPINDGVFEDSVRPIIEAGLADLIDPPHALTDELTIEAAPGHSPGHCIMVLRSKGETAIFSGDTMHQPVQVHEPHLNSCFCAEPELARQTRRALLERCASANGLILPAHFGKPHAGRVTERGGEFSISFDSI